VSRTFRTFSEIVPLAVAIGLPVAYLQPAGPRRRPTRRDAGRSRSHWPGMSGIPVVLGGDQSPLSIYIQVAVNVAKYSCY
jgi:hypothetical protein